MTKQTLPVAWTVFLCVEERGDYARYEVEVDAKVVLILTKDTCAQTRMWEVSLEVRMDDVPCPRDFHNYARFSYYGPGTQEECIKRVEDWAVQAGMVTR